jgi:hypothetical protein
MGIFNVAATDTAADTEVSKFDMATAGQTELETYIEENNLTDREPSKSTHGRTRNSRISAARHCCNHQ